MKEYEERYDAKDHLRRIQVCLRNCYPNMKPAGMLEMTCIMVLAEADELVTSVCDVMNGEGNAFELKDALESVRKDLAAQEVILKNMTE